MLLKQITFNYHNVIWCWIQLLYYKMFIYRTKRGEGGGFDTFLNVISITRTTMRRGVPILEETIIQRQQQQLQHWSPGALVWPREVYITLNQTNYCLKLI